jgi:hypothetical protein
VASTLQEREVERQLRERVGRKGIKSGVGLNERREGSSLGWKRDEGVQWGVGWGGGGGLDKKNLGGKRRWEEGWDEEIKRRWVPGLELGEEGDIKEG